MTDPKTRLITLLSEMDVFCNRAGTSLRQDRQGIADRIEAAGLLAGSVGVPSRHELDVLFYGNEGKPDPFGSGKQVFSMEKGLDAIHAHLAAQQPPRVDLSLGDFRTLEQWERSGDAQWPETLARLSDLEKLLALPQTEKGEGWISVDERLPDEGQLVLATGYKFNNPDNDRWQIVSKFKDGTFAEFVADFSDSEDGGYWKGESYTTDWQPLPSPPHPKTPGR
jgi:hypothetical protein